MANLICVQLETCHHNRDACAWYAYFDDVPTKQDHQDVFNDLTKIVDGGCLGESGDLSGPDEDPTALSRYAKLRRFYVADAS